MTLFPAVLMSIRRCVSQARQTRQCPLRTLCGASFPRKSWCAARRAAIRPTATRLGLQQDLSRSLPSKLCGKANGNRCGDGSSAAGRRYPGKIQTPGDIIILLGGRTGRDGCGGATGSSKVHTTASLTTCGAEVQKEMRRQSANYSVCSADPRSAKSSRSATTLAQAACLLQSESFADGLVVDMDKVPKKYAGLDGTELAISESQERMAVVVGPKDADQFLAYAAEENLEAVKVAVVTEEPRLVLKWRGSKVVDIARAFLDTNGAHQETGVFVETHL